MIERFNEIMVNQCGLEPGEKVLVAVSGGVDSIALLSLAQAAGYEIVVGHLDHGLRESSRHDANFVRSEVEKLGLEIITERVNARTFAEEEKLSLEEAARELRYKFLFRAAEVTGCQAVAAGHHVGDQAETVLLHILRGTGLKGLSGMAFRTLTRWHPEIVLVRPLLEITKKELDAYRHDLGLRTIKDESNTDVGFLRNRVRHEILPILWEINPQIELGLGRLAKTARDDLFLLKELTGDAWEEIFHNVDDKSVQLQRAGFVSMPRGLQRRIIRKAISQLVPGAKNIGLEHVDGVIDAVISPSRRGVFDLAQGIGLKVDTEVFAVQYWDIKEDLSGYPQLVKEEKFSLSGPGRYPLGSGWEIEYELNDSPSYNEIRNNTDTYMAFLDAGKISGAIQVRMRMGGDRISPLGMDGRSLKVSDLMINECIPSVAREMWPIFEVDGMVVWVPGCRISHHLSVRAGTQQVVLLRLRRRGN